MSLNIDSGFLELDEQTTPTTNPPTGRRLIYPKAAGWYSLDSSGTETEIGGAGDLKADGSVPLSANWDAGSFQIRAETFQSDVVTGTAPLTVASSTLVANLNADRLDSQEGTYYLDLTNATGTLGIAAGGTGQGTAPAAYDALSPMTTLGDIEYFSTTGARLAGNTTTTKQLLSQTGNGAVSAAPVWSVLVAGDIPDLSGTYQILDAELSAIAGLASAADRLPYFTGLGTADLAVFTAAGRALLDDADSTAQRATLGLVISTDVQPWAAELDTYVANPLVSGELTQLQAIGATTISATQWGYVGAADQQLAVADSPTFGGLTLDGQLTWNTGAGAISHLLGPSDQNTIVRAGTARSLHLQSPTGGNVLEIQTSSQAVWHKKQITLDNTWSLWGNGSDCGIQFNTNQTVDAMYVGVDATSRSVLVGEVADVTTNRGLAGQTNPTLFVFSADATDTSDFISITHDQTNAVIGVGQGDLAIDGADGIRFDEVASHGTPASGTVSLWAKTDGLIYSTDDAGVDTLVSGSVAGASLPSGTVVWGGWAAAPTGFLDCDGAAVSRTTYAALFTAIGTAFGAGDGSTTFNVPDGEGRSPIGVGTGDAGDATAWTLAEKGGQEDAIVVTHNHDVDIGKVNSQTPPATGGSIQMRDNGTQTATTTNAGSSGTGKNMHPVLGLRAVIKT